MFADDAALFAEFFDPVEWTPSAGGGLRRGVMQFDQPTELVGNDLSAQYRVLFETAAWPGLKRNEVLLINGDGKGQRYRLRTDPLPKDDGVFSQVELTLLK